jgi:ornithine cyclodeaminase
MVMRVVTSAEIDRVLTFPALIAALADAFSGDMVAPVRHHHEVERQGSHGTLLLMPAWTGPASADSFMGVKVVSVFPDNGAKNLASVLGTYLLMDGATGEPRAAMDGTRLTVWRTAAASALAARSLARPDTARMVMVGAGSLAPFLIRAHMSQRPISDVLLWNHRPEKAEALAADLRQQGLPVTATANLEAAVRQADLVSCATLSRQPIVKGEWLKAGTHVDLVGAFNLAMREVDDAALQRSRIYVDTKAAKSEGGDVALALQSGAIADDDVRGDLFDLCAHSPERDASAITLFKSVGASLEDLAAAMLVWRGLAKTG